MTHPTSKRRSSARRSSKQLQSNARLYHVVVINEKTKGKAYLTAYPVTHAEGITVLSKCTPRKQSRYQLEETRSQSVSPTGIIYPEKLRPNAPAVIEKAVKAGRLHSGSLGCRFSDQQKLDRSWRRACAAVERAYPNTDAVDQVIVRVEQLGPLTPMPGKDI